MLKRYTRELEESNQLKDLFIDIVQHDLLSPMGSIRNLAEISLKTASDPTIAKDLASILTASKKMIDLIQNASTFAKLESGVLQKFDERDLADMAHSAIASLTPLVREKKMRLVLYHPDKCMALVNPLIWDIFSNLIGNAIKYSPEGSPITVSIEEKDSNWRITVADRGEGIPDEDKTAVFNRFTRLAKGGIKGTGLGLAIVKGVVDIHGGKVWVEDNPGGGALFVVELGKTGTGATSTVPDPGMTSHDS